MPTAAPNAPLTGTQADTLRTILTGEIARRDCLQQQHHEMENAVSEAKKSAAALTDCKSASQQAQRACEALKVAIQEAKDSVSKALAIHDAQVDVVNETSTLPRVREAWDGLTLQFEGLAHQLDEASVITTAHIITTSDQAASYCLAADCTQESLNALDLRIDALSASILSKAGILTSILHLPDDVLRLVFQLAVEDERAALRAEFTAPDVDFARLGQMRRSIPKCAFRLAAVCRRSRALALDMPTLWSYLRAPTWIRSSRAEDAGHPLYRGVGKSAYECCLRRTRSRGTTPELVLYPFSLESSEFMMGLKPYLRSLQVHLVRPTRIPGWLPIRHHLSIYGAGRPPLWDGADDLPRIELQRSLIHLNELTCTNVIPSFKTPMVIQTFTFHSEARSQIPSVEYLSEMLPILQTLRLLLPEFPSKLPAPWTVPRTWESLTTLAITSSALPCLATRAREGLLPSLTTVILVNMFPSFKPTESERIKSIFQFVASLEILDVSASVTSSDLRVFINWMGGLESIAVHGLAVEKTVEALSEVPVKAITSLLIQHSTFDGAGLTDYAALLQGDNIRLPQTSFINCNSVPAEVRQLFIPTQ